MEALSVATGIIGLVAAAYHCTQQVMQFIDGIQGAPQAVKALSRDLRALAKVLQTLSEILTRPDFQVNARSNELVTLLKNSLENCTLALEDISLAVKPYTKPSGDPRKSKWRGFTWMFREKEILTLQRMLMSYKSSLNMAVAVANLSTTTTGFTETKREIRGLQHHLNVDSRSIADSSFEGSEATGSDPGFALRRYLLQPEIDGQQIYEMGSNVSESQDSSYGSSGELETEEKIASGPLPFSKNATSDTYKERDTDWPESQVLTTSEGLEAALLTVRPNISESIQTNALSPTFGIDLEVLYQRDRIFVPRVVQFCIAVVEQVARRTWKVYDSEAARDDLKHLKERFGNGRPLKVNAEAILDHRTVDPRKLKFFKGDRILVLEPRGETWFLGRHQDTTGLLPIDFVYFSVEDIADVIGACKVFFMDLPDSLLPMAQCHTLIKAAGIESAPGLHDRIMAMIHRLSLARFELLKAIILHLHRISMGHSDIVRVAMDLARWWAPILMRSKEEGAIAKQELELQVRVVQTLITSAEEVFGSDPTERFADPSFSSVTLLPNIRPSVASESEPSKPDFSSVYEMSFRSLWRSALSSVPQVVSKCTQIIESDKWTSRVYRLDAPELDVIRAWSWLNTSQPLAVATNPFAPSLLAFATLLGKLIAANPNALLILDENVLTTMTTATAIRSSSFSTVDDSQSDALHRKSTQYEVLKMLMLHLCHVSEKYKNAFYLAQIWTPILNRKMGSASELRRYCDYVQYMIMEAYELFEEPRPKTEQPTIYELE